MGPALIAFSVAIVLAIFAGVVYLAFAAPAIFLALLVLLAGYFGLAYRGAAREAKRAADERAEGKPE